MDQAKANPAVTELFNDGDASLVYKERQVRKLRQKTRLRIAKLHKRCIKLLMAYGNYKIVGLWQWYSMAVSFSKKDIYIIYLY